MNHCSLLALIGLIGFGLHACKEKEELDPVTASMISELNSELAPLPDDPATWTDDQMRFMDAASDHAIVGLGEATHGTSEFFRTKHRIFKYMAENHGFRIFAIEADFGESIFINKAIMNSDKSSIESLMKTKMMFWTWKTAEVRDMLLWMCDYNVGKPDDQKVQYWGVDCQYNEYHPKMVKDYLQSLNAPFISFATDVLDEAFQASTARFQGFSLDAYGKYLQGLQALQDSVIKYEDTFSQKSIQEYQLTLKLMEVIFQVSEVLYKPTLGYASPRDEYMAKNASWLHEQFKDEKIVLWAHNFHISNDRFNKSMGNYLKNSLSDNYFPLGFLFSKGQFMAITQTGQSNGQPEGQSLDENPALGSLNDLMSRASTSTYTVSVPSLEDHAEWSQSLPQIQFFQMGAAYDGKPADYYTKFDPELFERLIFFKDTNAAAPL